MEAVDTRAVRGIRAYLERRGFEILEEGWAHGGDVADFIARDEDDLVRFDVVNLLVVGEGRTLLRYHPGAEAPGGGLVTMISLRRGRTPCLGRYIGCSEYGNYYIFIEGANPN